VVNVPLLGQVAAGQPILAVENITNYFPIPAEYLPNDETFMLKVKGDSMVNMGIYEGDMIMVRKQSTARNGEVVVAMVEDSATVKRFYKEDGHYRLQPENDFMDPIIVDSVEIIGKVIGLIRLNIA
jgi:repressor LexA